MLNSLKRTDPEDSATGLLIRIYTDQTDPPYPFYWTLGHLNLWAASGGAAASSVKSHRVGRWMRVDHWTPAIGDSAFNARDTYARVFALEMAA